MLGDQVVPMSNTVVISTLRTTRQLDARAFKLQRFCRSTQHSRRKWLRMATIPFEIGEAIGETCRISRQIHGVVDPRYIAQFCSPLVTNREKWVSDGEVNQKASKTEVFGRRVSDFC